MWETIFGWIFSWTGILVLVPTVMCFGWGAMSMSPPACWIARCLFTIGVLLLLGKLGPLAISTEPSIIRRMMTVFIVFGLIGSGWVELMKWVNDRELLLTSGLLNPDNKPNPTILNNLTIPPNNIVLILGRYITYTEIFPFTIIKLDDKPLITINKIKDKLLLSGEFYSRDRKIVAQITNNKFFINPNNYFRIKRPNYHKLIVIDQENNLVLDVDFVNKSVVNIIGDYYPPNANLSPLIINDKFVRFGHLKIEGTIQGHMEIHLKSDGTMLFGDFSY